MRHKILVVDDEPDIVELVAFNLEAAGYRVITATNGMEALNRARAILPDLIVLDLMLPELDGLSVCEILSRLPSTAPIPVIILTAWKGEISRMIGLEAGGGGLRDQAVQPARTGVAGGQGVARTGGKDSGVGGVGVAGEAVRRLVC